MSGDVECHVGCGDGHDAAGCEELSCRICFDEVLKASELVSPCKCQGTLKYVHPGCLARWQSSVIRFNGPHDERAYICSVCRAPYTIRPPRPDPWRRVAHAVRGITGAACISMLALGLTGGTPLLHLALVAVLLLGSLTQSTRSQSVMLMLALVVASMFAALYLRGLRLVVRLDVEGRYGLAVIRHGAAVPGLGAGTLLVASRQLDGTLFANTVVLLTEKGPHGARGVMLTQPIESGGPLLLNHPSAGSLAASHAVRHFMGGPVGADFRGGQHAELLALHQQPGLQGARQLLPISRPPPPLVAAHTGPGSADAQADGGGAAEAQAQQQAQEQVQLHKEGRMDALGWRQLCRLLRIGAFGATGDPQGTGGAQAPYMARGPGSGLHHGRGATGIYLGGDLDELLLLVQRMGGLQAVAGRVMGPPVTPQVRLFHGVCAWAAGQLEGEVRSGAWGLADATPADVLTGQPQQLWQQLTADDGRAVRWV